MSASETAADSTGTLESPERVELGVYPTFTAGSERGLVVLALGSPYWLEESPAGFRLSVETAASANAREQLAKFERENLHWPPAPRHAPVPADPGGIADAFGWVALLCASLWAQGHWPGAIAAGALDATRVFGHGEFWRIATALGLHADPRHFLANLLSGALVVAAVTSTLGRMRGWLSLAAAALLGNLGAVTLHSSAGYRSIGASTAVFAGLGLLTGRALWIAARSAPTLRWRAVFVPIGAGVSVLALYGAGGVNVDVLAHVSGFVCGLVLGGAIGAGRITSARSG